MSLPSSLGDDPSTPTRAGNPAGAQGSMNEAPLSGNAPNAPSPSTILSPSKADKYRLYSTYTDAQKLQFKLAQDRTVEREIASKKGTLTKAHALKQFTELWEYVNECYYPVEPKWDELVGRLGVLADESLKDLWEVFLRRSNSADSFKTRLANYSQGAGDTQALIEHYARVYSKYYAIDHDHGVALESLIAEMQAPPSGSLPKTKLRTADLSILCAALFTDADAAHRLFWHAFDELKITEAVRNQRKDASCLEAMLGTLIDVIQANKASALQFFSVVYPEIKDINPTTSVNLSDGKEYPLYLLYLYNFYSPNAEKAISTPDV